MYEIPAQGFGIAPTVHDIILQFRLTNESFAFRM
jgi:hypothetical protein